MRMHELHRPNLAYNAPRLPHASLPGTENLSSHETSHDLPDELPNWESVWIDLGGEG